MKRGTPRHPKVIALAEQLGIEVYAAAGLLELLWHFTSEYAPAGDIGRHSNASIAKALFWRQKPDKLIYGLVAAKWVDLTEPDRLAVHDWSEHADDTTHNKLARAKKFFSDGSAPSLKRLPPKDRTSAEEFYGANPGSKKAHAKRTESAFEAHSGLGLAKAVLDVSGKESVRENPPLKIAPADESFAPNLFEEIMGLFVALGRGAGIADLIRCENAWKGLTPQQRNRAHEHAMRSLAEWRTRPTTKIAHPWNYLADKHWERETPRLLQQTRAPTKADLANEEAGKRFREMPR